MRRSLLGAAMVAAMAFALGIGAQAADAYYVGGGGGGGGKADGTNLGTGGEKGLADSNGDGTNEASAGGAGGNSGGTGGSEGGTGSGADGTAGNQTSTGSGDGGTGADGESVESVTATAGGDTLHFLGGFGGNGGAGVDSVGTGGGGGAGGHVTVTLTGGAEQTAAINIIAGDGGDAGAEGGSNIGGMGGTGGSVAITYSGTDPLEISGAVAITAGDTGTGDAGSNEGGSGGSAEFNAANADVILSSAVTLTAGDADTDSATNAGGNAVFKVRKLSSGTSAASVVVAGTVTGAGVGKKIIEIGSIEAIDNDMTLNFDGKIDTTKVNNGTDGDTVSIGDITVGAGKTFSVTNFTGGLGTASGWTGNLNTIDDVTVAGLDLTDKTINATLTGDGSSGFDLSSDTVISGASTVGAGTTVNLNLDAEMGAAIAADPTKTITLFDTGTVLGLANVDETKITVSSGAYGGAGTFDSASGKFENIALSLDTGSDGEAYNMLLAMPAVVALVNGGGDVVEKVTSAFSPLSFRQNSALSGVQFGAFASLGGGHIEVDTGSGVDSDNFHMLVGPGIRVATGTGTTDFGAFFEAGWGGYDAYNATYRGEGDTSYYGGGLLVRHETCSGLYGEASLRIGGAKSEYNSNRNNDFETKSTYFGGHVGLGYIFRPTATSSVDVFAKGLLTRVGDDTTKDKAGYEMNIDSTTSVRTHLGAKYSYNFLPNASFFVKGVWEHEFDGETGGRYDNVAIKKNADAGGSSAIGEIGVDWKAAERVTLGASVYGVVGQRQGFGGNVNIGLGF